MSQNNINTMAAESFSNLIRSLNLEPNHKATVFKAKDLVSEEYLDKSMQSIIVSDASKLMSKFNEFAPLFGKDFFGKSDVAVILQKDLQNNLDYDNNVEDNSSVKPLGIKIK